MRRPLCNLAATPDNCNIWCLSWQIFHPNKWQPIALCMYLKTDCLFTFLTWDFSVFKIALNYWANAKLSFFNAGRHKLRCFGLRWALSCQRKRLCWPGVNRNQKFTVKRQDFDWFLQWRWWKRSLKRISCSIIDMISSEVPLSDKVEGEFITYLLI